MSSTIRCPNSSFDLVHERLVLVHVPERVAALGRLVSALRPGGWLLAEDFDSEIAPDPFLAPLSDEEELGNTMMRRGPVLARPARCRYRLRSQASAAASASRPRDRSAPTPTRRSRRATRSASCDGPTSPRWPTRSSSRRSCQRDELERYLIAARRTQGAARAHRSSCRRGAGARSVARWSTMVDEAPT